MPGAATGQTAFYGLAGTSRWATVSAHTGLVREVPGGNPGREPSSPRPLRGPRLRERVRRLAARDPIVDLDVAQRGVAAHQGERAAGHRRQHDRPRGARVVVAPRAGEAVPDGLVAPVPL